MLRRVERGGRPVVGIVGRSNAHGRHRTSQLSLSQCAARHEGGLGDPGHEAFEMHNSLPGQFAVEFVNFPRLSKKGLESLLIERPYGREGCSASGVASELSPQCRC